MLTDVCQPRTGILWLKAHSERGLGSRKPIVLAGQIIKTFYWLTFMSQQYSLVNTPPQVPHGRNFLQNWSHIQTQSKSQHIQQNLNNFLHPVRPPQIKVKYQQWQKHQKAYKLLEPEHLSNECKMGQNRNKEIKDFLEITIQQTECFIKNYVYYSLI